MNFIFGLLLAALGTAFLVFHRRFAQMSFDAQQAMTGRVQGRAARVLKGYITIVIRLSGVGLTHQPKPKSQEG